MTEPFAHLRAATARTAAPEVEHDIVSFHRGNPGITERTLGVARSNEGLTGYDLLVDALPADARSVLDLGCGNGPLLASLLARRPALAQYVGLDACDSDAQLARERFTDPRVTVHTGRGQALPLADASMDAVLSHHALYLFEPLEPALREVARVLRPGGLLAFATSSPDTESFAVFRAMMRAMSQRTVLEAPHFRGWGDARVWSLESLESLLFREPGGFEGPLTVRPYVLHLREPAEALSRRLAAFFYSAWLHREATREGLVREWTALLEPTVDAQGNAHFAWPLAQVEVRRAQGGSK